MPADTPGRWLGGGIVRLLRLARTPAARAALVAGFGTILVLWGIVGASFARRTREGDAQSAAITARYAHGREVLATVQTQIVLGSVYLRDALLDVDAARVGAYGRQMLDAYTAADLALSDYQPVVDSPAMRAHVDELRHRLRRLRSTRMAILSARPHSPVAAAGVLRREAAPQRENLLVASRQIEALDRDAYADQKAQIAVIDADTERQIWRSLVAALVATLAVAVLATEYVDRLERRVRNHHEREMQNARDLQELSSQLVTAQEDERRLIARELHDEVGQILTALKIRLALAKPPAGVDAPFTAAFDEARGLAVHALQAVRDVARLLHPPALDDLGLAAALETQVSAFADGHGLRVDVSTEGLDQRLDPVTELAAYRIVQEALTNVARHAGGTVCQVRLARTRDRLVVTIDDDGRGIDPSADSRSTGASGLGLLGIRERVAQLQGTLRLESAVGRGTRLTFELPVRESDPAGPRDDRALPAVAHAGVVHG